MVVVVVLGPGHSRSATGSVVSVQVGGSTDRKVLCVRVLLLRVVETPSGVVVGAACLSWALIGWCSFGTGAARI